MLPRPAFGGSPGVEIAVSRSSLIPWGAAEKAAIVAKSEAEIEIEF
jgi:hypothetical protein